jgi:hypothetical protein
MIVRLSGAEGIRLAVDEHAEFAVAVVGSRIYLRENWSCCSFWTLFWLGTGFMFSLLE